MNDTIALLARVLLSAIFVISGFYKAIGIAGVTAYLTRLGVPLPHIAAYVVTAIELVGGLMILFGFMTRWAALLLCAFSAATLYMGHKFWAVEAAQYQNQFNHALKNLGLMGGFLLLFLHGPGRYSVDGRR